MNLQSFAFDDGSVAVVDMDLLAVMETLHQSDEYSYDTKGEVLAIDVVVMIEKKEKNE